MHSRQYDVVSAATLSDKKASDKNGPVESAKEVPIGSSDVDFWHPVDVGQVKQLKKVIRRKLRKPEQLPPNQGMQYGTTPT